MIGGVENRTRSESLSMGRPRTEPSVTWMRQIYQNSIFLPFSIFAAERPASSGAIWGWTFNRGRLTRRDVGDG